jgi:integrase
MAKKKSYRLPARCHVCGKEYLARYNVGQRAKVCTPPEHECRKGTKGGKKVMCVETCCRSKYARAASDAAMDAAIDTRKLLSEEEFEKVVKASRSLRDPEGIALRFISETGVRMGEALLVRSADFNWQDGPFSSVRVPTLKRSGGGRPPRSVHIDNSSPIAKELKAWLKGIEAGGLAFPVARRTLQAACETILDPVKPDRHSLVHIFRHTRASKLIRAGAPLNYVRQQLGWSSLEMAKVYAHTAEDEIAAVMKKLR